MKLIFVHKILPVLIIYLKNMPKFLKHRNSVSFGPLILMKDIIKDNQIQHVRKKVKSGQIYRSFGFHKLFYKYYPQYRLKCALEVYKAEISLYPASKQLNQCIKSANIIIKKYDLHAYYTTHQVTEMILSRFGIPYINSASNRHTI